MLDRLIRTVTVSIAATGLVLAMLASAFAGARELPRVGADLSATTVSGISSGAYMAGQFELAHADIVIGAAIVAGGPYGCAESAFSGFAFGPAAVMLNFNQAVTGCMMGAMSAFGVPSPSALADRARRRSHDGEIGQIADVVGDRIFLFSGTRDQLVAPSIVQAAAQFYAELGVPAERIALVDTVPAGHGFVTESEGDRCGVTRAPFVVDCDLDLAGQILGHLYGSLSQPTAPVAGAFTIFEQYPFAAGLRTSSIASEGVAFVPDSCTATPGCRIHIAFHGCGQGRSSIGDTFITGSGFARWAAANRLIVLFPQVAASSMNPQGCWDWWGYTGSNFLTRKAPQIVAVRRMIDALAQRP